MMCAFMCWLSRITQCDHISLHLIANSSRQTQQQHILVETSLAMARLATMTHSWLVIESHGLIVSQSHKGDKLTSACMMRHEKNGWLAGWLAGWLTYRYGCGFVKMAIDRVG